MQKADLVLEGGGVRGIGLLGAATVLVEHGYTFPRIAGTSAGAIVGSLIASHQAAGKPVSDLVPVMEALDYQKFADGTFLDKFGMLGKGIELLAHDGIYKGDHALAWITEQLAGCGVRTWADLRSDDPDSSLPPEQRYRLVVCASDLSRGQLMRLPWDYHYYGLNPDEQSVALAVRASMSVPFFFRPVTFDTGDRTGKCSLVDGGMLSDFPIELFDRTDGQPARWPTVGVKLSGRPGARQVTHPVSGPADLAMAALRTLLNGHDEYHLDDENTVARTVFVDTDKVDSMNFSIDRKTQQFLYTSGRTAATTFLEHRTVQLSGS